MQNKFVQFMCKNQQAKQEEALAIDSNMKTLSCEEETAPETSKCSKLDALVRVYHQEQAGEFQNYCSVDIFPVPVFKKIPLNTRLIQKKTDLSNRLQKFQKNQINMSNKKVIIDKNNAKSQFPLYMDEQYILKMKAEKQLLVRQASYRDYLQVINFSNNLFVNIPPEKNAYSYRCHVGKGNNQMLIKSLLKMRWWWNIVELKNYENIPNLNFLWTQLKKTDFFDNMGQLKRQKSISLVPKKFSRPSISQHSKSEELILINPEKNGQNQLMMKLLNQDDYFLLNEEFQASKRHPLIIEALKDEDHIRGLKNSQNRQLITYQDSTNTKMCNHLEHNYHLGNKKALYYNLKDFCEKNKLQLFEIVPVTFHIQNGKNDEQYTKFIEQYHKIQKQLDAGAENLTNTWIIKPGEQSNRGTGIKICNELAEIKYELEQYDVHKNGNRKTYIVQKYIDNPLLYQKRKFDIRCYQLITSINGNIKGYWYQEGYVRTSSKDFSLKNLNKFIHLTNDAVQKKNEGYGKFEKGNKVSFEELAKYIKENCGDVDFFEQVYPQMKEISVKTIKSAYKKLDPLRRQNGFELYGLDFMIDTNLKVWLLEENTNPALDICCSLLSKIIPGLIDNVFRIAVDPIFPPPPFNGQKKVPHENLLQINKFELIFDEQMEEPCEDLIGYINIEEEEDEEEYDDE